MNISERQGSEWCAVPQCFEKQLQGNRTFTPKQSSQLDCSHWRLLPPDSLFLAPFLSLCHSFSLTVSQRRKALQQQTAPHDGGGGNQGELGLQIPVRVQCACVAQTHIHIHRANARSCNFHLHFASTALDFHHVHWQSVSVPITCYQLPARLAIREKREV